MCGNLLAGRRQVCLLYHQRETFENSLLKRAILFPLSLIMLLVVEESIEICFGAYHEHQVL